MTYILGPRGSFLLTFAAAYVYAYMIIVRCFTELKQLRESLVNYLVLEIYNLTRNEWHMLDWFFIQHTNRDSPVESEIHWYNPKNEWMGTYV